MAKRAIDILLAAWGLLLIGPLLLLISMLILVRYGRPVFYRGRRTGRHGRPFRIFKFRTMVSDAELKGGTSTAANDPRITPLGGFLRKNKLDELPQLLNVLSGSMSFVGPRPEVEEYTRLYSDEERLILSVRPGITDYSSIRFSNLNTLLAQSNEDPDSYYREVIRPIKNKLRLEYARHHNAWIDLKILMKTVQAILHK